MALPEIIFRTVEFQLERVLEVGETDPELSTITQKLAYYNAMIEASEEDPLDDPDNQTEILEFLRTKREYYVEAYRNLINKVL